MKQSLRKLLVRDYFSLNGLTKYKRKVTDYICICSHVTVL